MSDDAPHESEVVYADPAMRRHALHLGMWLFLGSETLLFAGLFGLYAAYRALEHDAFANALHHNNAIIGTLNTGVLLVSSFFVAVAVFAVRLGRSRRLAVGALAVAITLGLTFLVIKSIEYSHHFAEGIKPGAFYASTELPDSGSRTFFTLYYVMTGLHALHVIAGMVILAWLARGIHRERITREHHTPLELGGLYWHLVDIVWIFLWPLLYLAG
jgi:cytochrome c oxidase subunit 3